MLLSETDAVRHESAPDSTFPLNQTRSHNSHKYTSRNANHRPQQRAPHDNHPLPKSLRQRHKKGQSAPDLRLHCGAMPTLAITSSLSRFDGHKCLEFQGEDMVTNNESPEGF